MKLNPEVHDLRLHRRENLGSEKACLCVGVVCFLVCLCRNSALNGMRQNTWQIVKGLLFKALLKRYVQYRAWLEQTVVAELFLESEIFCPPS